VSIGSVRINIVIVWLYVNIMIQHSGKVSNTLNVIISISIPLLVHRYIAILFHDPIVTVPHFKYQ